MKRPNTITTITTIAGLVAVATALAFIHQTGTLSDKNAQLSDLRSETARIQSENEELTTKLAAAQAEFDQPASTDTAEVCSHANDATQAAAYAVIGAFAPGNTEGVRTDAIRTMTAVEGIQVACHGGTRIFPFAGM